MMLTTQQRTGPLRPAGRASGCLLAALGLCLVVLALVALIVGDQRAVREAPAPPPAPAVTAPPAAASAPPAPATAACSACQGSGWATCPACLGGQVACQHCGGSGSVRRPSHSDGHGLTATAVRVMCPVCGGSGHLSCPRCGGTGLIPCDRCRGTGKLPPARPAPSPQASP